MVFTGLQFCTEELIAAESNMYSREGNLNRYTKGIHLKWFVLTLKQCVDFNAKCPKLLSDNSNTTTLPG